MALNSDELFRHPSKGIKHGDSIELMACNEPYSGDNFLNGKVIGEFICDDIDEYSMHYEILYNVKNSQANKLKQACLTIEEIKAYFGENNYGYGWHISDLKIYDKLKELGEFRKSFKYDKEGFLACDHPISFTCKSKQQGNKICDIKHCEILQQTYPKLTKAPQSWQYVNYVEKEN